MTFADHFSSFAHRYANYRPTYPQALADALAELAPATGLAWDAGCGNGQMSLLLAQRFTRVVATDPSQQQLDVATAHPSIEYHCVKAEDALLPADSVDLAIAAQAAHWFDWQRYVDEVARVTRPGSIVALVCYGLMYIDGEVDDLVRRYYADDVGPYWPAGREHIDNGYRDLVLPWTAVAMPAFPMTASWTRAELVGYLATWSATAKYIADKGPLAFERLQAALTEVWPDDDSRMVTWPTTVKVARR